MRPVQERHDVYTRVTETIIAAIEAGAFDKRMPWHHDGRSAVSPVNIASGHAYRGINVLVLAIQAMMAGHRTGLWGTYKQWAEKGAQVRKGEKGTGIVFWKFLDAAAGDSEAEDGESDEQDGRRRRAMARGYTVFNVAQVDGYEAPEPAPRPALEHNPAIEAFFAECRIKTVIGGAQAHYRPATDEVHLPPFDAFISPAAAYSVQAHEYAHATGSMGRLDRDMSGKFGDDAYAMEELVAELTASMITADFGIANELVGMNASYIQNWLKLCSPHHNFSYQQQPEAQSEDLLPVLDLDPADEAVVTPVAA